MAYVTELETFTVKPGMEARAEEWMQMLRDRRAECIPALEREKMHYECIFKSVRDGRLRLTWFNVQGETGEFADTSDHPVDILHVQFWRECIDRTIPPEKFEHIITFAPPSVERVIDERDQS